MSPKKILILAAAGLAVVLLLGLVVFITSAGGGKKTQTASGATGTGAQKFSVWIVGDDTAGYSEILKGFKTRYPQYATAEIQLTKFASYDDYEKILLNVMATGNSPDVFMVEKNSDEALFADKTYEIPNEVIPVDTFSKNFNKIFDDLVTTEKTKNDKGEEVTAYGLKGVPMGYQTLGLYYDFRSVRNVPTTWADVDTEIKSNETENYAPMGLGLSSRYVPFASDIVRLLLLQNGVSSYSKMTDTAALAAISGYTSFAADPKNPMEALKPQMDSLYLDAVDLFVRGKIGMLIGYPSMIEPIREAIKRAGSEATVGEKFLRTAAVPQLTEKPEDAKNLVTYRYFVASRFTRSPELTFAFLRYLAEQEAQKAYVAAFPFYLPAFKALDSERADKAIDPDMPRVRYEHFMGTNVALSGFDTGLLTSLRTAIDFIVSAPNADLAKVVGSGVKYVNCAVDQYVNLKQLDIQCSLNP